VKTGVHSSEAGMSLVEIMVALFIVGLASGAVMLSLPSSPDRLGQVQLMLSDAISEARKAAQFSGQPYGFNVDDNGVTPLIFAKGGWIPVTTGMAFEFPEGVRVELLKTETRRGLERNPEDEPLVAEIWFDPSGIATAIPLVLLWKGVTVEIGIDEYGEVSFSD
jgi:type II secretion system protein H